MPPKAPAVDARTLPIRTDGALISMETAHRAVLETVRRIVTGENDVSYASIRDFDHNELQVRITEDASALVIGVTHAVPEDVFQKHCAAELKEVLTRHFGSAVAEQPDDGCLVSVNIPLPAEEPETVVQNPLLSKAASLRTLCYAAFFFKVAASKTPMTIRLPRGPSESAYVHGSAGNVNVSFSIHVPNDSDAIFVRTFLSEMKIAKTTSVIMGFDRGVTPTFPGGVKAVEKESDQMFWAHFKMSQVSLDSPALLEKSVEHLMNFRAFLFYHINCSRSMVHARMRERVRAAEQVLTS